MVNQLLIIILVILLFGYILERFLNYLNGLKWSDNIPAELEGIYDPERYKKSMAYQRENRKFGFITSSVSLVIMILLNGMFSLMNIPAPVFVYLAVVIAAMIPLFSSRPGEKKIVGFVTLAVLSTLSFVSILCYYFFTG